MTDRAKLIEETERDDGWAHRHHLRALRWALEYRYAYREMVRGIAELHAGLKAKIETGEIARPQVCGWCGRMVLSLEEVRAHTVECPQNPAVRRVERLECALRRLLDACGDISPQPMSGWGSAEGHREMRELDEARDAALLTLRALSPPAPATKDKE